MSCCQLSIISSMLLVMFVATEGKLQCQDEDSNPVDWYVAYKLPELKNSSHAFIQKGLGYMYITSNTVDKGWTVSAKSINKSDSLPGNTLKTLYDTSDNSDLLWLVYNDETPNKTVTFDLGHTKGVVLAEVEGGIWLVHSVPRYPPVPGTIAGSYSYPKSGTHFGQSFLCMSLAVDQMDLVGRQLRYNEPQVYSSNVPPALRSSLPNLAAAAVHNPVTTAPWYHQEQLTTLGGVPFHTFAKTKQFGKDLYADWVAPTLKVNLLVETWPNGHGRLPSECQLPYKVKNVEGVKLTAANASFKAHVDHSKWGVGTENTNPWVCVGDINRMKSQEARSGGTVCISNPQLWTAYRQAVTDVEPCGTGIFQFLTDMLW